jgi:Domain of unknown function (DUF4157)
MAYSRTTASEAESPDGLRSNLEPVLDPSAEQAPIAPRQAVELASSTPPASGLVGSPAGREATVLRMQNLHGNLAVQRFVHEQTSAQTPSATDDGLARRIDAASGSGASLEPRVQRRLENGLGADLSAVKVHTDQEADSLASEVSAVAFTTGTDIFFRSGAYSPATADGMQLLAHEATHVVQQSSGAVAGSPAPGGVHVSNPDDSFEQEASVVAARIGARSDEAAAEPAWSTSAAAGSGPVAQRVAVQREPDPSAGGGATATADPATSAVAGAAPEINPEDIWRDIEPQARTELLTKLQEIAAAAAEQTRQQIETLFGPYEDSIQSDQTFASYAAIGPWAAGGAVGAGGMVAGGLAGGAAQGVSAAFSHIMATNRVSEAKERARADTGSLVRSQVTSSSDLYNNFEAGALDEIRREFDESWANLTPEMKQGPQAQAVTRPFYTSWFRGIARAKYGTDSPDAQNALSSMRAQVDSGLAPVRAKLDEIKADQEKKRIGVGIAGGALLGGTIGTMIAPGIGTAIGAGIGAIVGGVAGWLW